MDARDGIASIKLPHTRNPTALPVNAAKQQPPLRLDRNAAAKGDIFPNRVVAASINPTSADSGSLR